jgi:hypothetical protein
MRILLKPFTRKAVTYPIETIVFFFVLSTLAYFRLLDAIKHSAFLAPSTHPASVQRPAYAAVHADISSWEGAPETAWKDAADASESRAVEVQQFIFSSDWAFENASRALVHDSAYASSNSAICARTSASPDSPCFVYTADLHTRNPALALETRSQPPKTPLAEVSSGMWIAYAARALVVRFWDLGKVSEIAPFERYP